MQHRNDMTQSKLANIDNDTWRLGAVPVGDGTYRGEAVLITPPYDKYFESSETYPSVHDAWNEMEKMLSAY
jgi:hypothetical protein